MENLWTDWPNRELDGIMKAYLLCQWAFWLQQMIVINIEERRKDHWQMFTHHIVTTALIFACYAYHHTRVGNFILVIMDVVDLFLPVSSRSYISAARLTRYSLPSVSSTVVTRRSATSCSVYLLFLGSSPAMSCTSPSAGLSTPIPLELCPPAASKATTRT